jgi:hypothetical protein
MKGNEYKQKSFKEKDIKQSFKDKKCKEVSIKEKK